MHNFQIGSLVLNGQLILYLGFGVAGWLMVYYHLRNKPAQEEVLSIISNAYWLWVLVWKASFLLFHPGEVIQQPMSLVYFDGGERGIWLASLVSVIYIWNGARKRNLSFTAWADLLIVYLLAGYLASQMLLLMTQTETIWFHVASLLISMLFLVLILVPSRSSNIYSARFNYAFWFCIGHIVLWFFVPERHAWLLSFNQQQVFFILAAAALAGTGWFSDKQQGGGTSG